MADKPDLTAKEKPAHPSGPELYNQALSRLQEDYIDAAKAQSLDSWKHKYSDKYLSTPQGRDKAIKDLAASLHDPWTQYVSKSEADHEQALSKAGYRNSGIWIRPDTTGYPEVQTVLKGFAAYDTAIRAGDRIKRVNGVDVFNRSEAQVEALLTKKSGTPMKIEFQMKEGGDGVATYKVRDAEEQHASAKVITGNNGEKIMYAYLPEFQLQALNDFDAAIDQRLKDNPGINMPMVLDMRGDSGGTMRAELYIDSEFLKSGVAYKQEIRDGKGVKIEDVPVDDSIYRNGSNTDKTRIDYLRNAPLVILMDDASRSAAESVTAALRARGRVAAVIGEKSFGKGIFFFDTELGDGTLRISEGLVRSPLGEEWHNKGLQPDVPVQRSRKKNSSDEQLAAGVVALENANR